MQFSAAATLRTFNLPQPDVFAEVGGFIPIPFGFTFALEMPHVTSVDPTSVSVGVEFTITGTGLYPTFVEAGGVLIGGQPAPAANISPDSDTEITVVAPNTPGNSLPVELRTTEGLSPELVTIDITPDSTAAGAAVPGSEG